LQNLPRAGWNNYGCGKFWRKINLINRNRIIVSALSAVILVTTASADLTVVPNQFTAAEGNSSSSTLFQAGASSLQVYYSADFIAAAGIGVGDTITGVAYRRTGGGATGPVGDTTMLSYNIFMSQSFATPGEMTTTYANNVVGGQMQVRTGSQTFLANSMPGGGTPNAFGSIVDFDTGYVYTGGSMLIEVRRSARTGDVTAFNTDVDNTAGSQVGARWLFNLTSDAATTGTLSSSAQIFQLEFTPVPEPSTLAVFAIGGLSLLAARRRSLRKSL
jgi:hypothetical protein